MVAKQLLKAFEGMRPQTKSQDSQTASFQQQTVTKFLNVLKPVHASEPCTSSENH